MAHTFTGKWITTGEFSDLKPRNIFHKQLEKVDLPCDKHRNRHILFRKKFTRKNAEEKATLFISADDYYKLYINGRFVGQGPAPSYHFQYNYNEIDVTGFLKPGENTIAVHTLYQGLINRVWQSGDNRHGMILDLAIGGKTVLSSGEDFKVCYHTGYKEIGTVGYDTQFLEAYDSAAAEVGFENPDFDDSQWENAKINRYADHTLVPQKSPMPQYFCLIQIYRICSGIYKTFPFLFSAKYDKISRRILREVFYEKTLSSAACSSDFIKRLRQHFAGTDRGYIPHLIHR